MTAAYQTDTQISHQQSPSGQFVLKAETAKTLAEELDQNDPVGPTADILAAQYGVSARTIRRDGRDFIDHSFFGCLLYFNEFVEIFSFWMLRPEAKDSFKASLQSWAYYG